MPNYKEATVTGTEWQRARFVTIDNTYQRIPAISFCEEILVDMGGGKIIQTGGANCGTSLEFPLTEFELINPLTDESLNVTVKYQDVQVMMYSLYMHLAAIRDAAQNQ